MRDKSVLCLRALLVSTTEQCLPANNAGACIAGRFFMDRPTLLNYFLRQLHRGQLPEGGKTGYSPILFGLIIALRLHSGK